MDTTPARVQCSPHATWDGVSLGGGIPVSLAEGEGGKEENEYNQREGRANTHGWPVWGFDFTVVPGADKLDEKCNQSIKGINQGRQEKKNWRSNSQMGQRNEIITDRGGINFLLE